MKKLFITLTAIVALAVTAKAQEFGFTKGNVLLEGNVGFSSTNNKNSEVKSNSFILNPRVGYFVSDKFVIGLDLAFTSGKEENYSAVSNTIEKNTAFGAGVFGRYYFLEIGKRFKTYAQALAGYATLKTEEKVGGTTVIDAKGNAFLFNAGIGANYFITERLALNVGLTDIVSFTSAKADGAKAVNSFEANVGGINNILDAATFGLTLKF